MYHVSAQGIDERMINVHYYYYYYRRDNTKHTFSLTYNDTDRTPGYPVSLMCNNKDNTP